MFRAIPWRGTLPEFYSGSAILSSSQTNISDARKTAARVPINNHIKIPQPIFLIIVLFTNVLDLFIVDTTGFS